MSSGGEVLKVVPSGIRFDETSCHAEAGAVVGGEHQGLLGGGRPRHDMRHTAAGSLSGFAPARSGFAPAPTLNLLRLGS